MNHVFLFFIVDVLRSWGLADLGGTVPTRASQFPELVNNMPEPSGTRTPDTSYWTFRELTTWATLLLL